MSSTTDDTCELSDAATFAQTPALDGLRGLAIVLVVLTHLENLAPDATGIADTIQRPSGSVGLDLFFALSGFLITVLLLQEHASSGTVRLGRFFGRRALRIIPALAAMLAAYLVYVMLNRRPDAVRTDFVSIVMAFAGMSNWHLVIDPLGAVPELGHLYSLAIEMQFYALWPLVVVLALRRPGLRRAIPFVLVAIGVAMSLNMARILDTGGDDAWFSALLRSDTRPTALVAGALAGWMYAAGRVPLVVARLLLLPALVAILAVTGIRGVDNVQMPVLVATFASPLLVLALVDGRSPFAALFRFAPLRVLGIVSYGVYLWHFPIFWALARHAGETSVWTRYAFGVVLTAVAATASWFLVEEPARRWGRRLRPPTAPEPPTGTVDEGDAAAEPEGLDEDDIAVVAI
jgi:peptidoglycan/LPS O-acetylase OafA/YrhL